MLKQFVRSVLCISFLITSAFATAEDLVENYNEVHHFAQDIDKQYAIKALTQSSLSRWNHDDPLGTPVTVTYAFAGEVLGYIAPEEYDVHRDFLDYERNAIIGVLDEASSFTNITFVEVTTIGETDFVIRISTAGSSATLAPTLADGDAFGYGTIHISDETVLRYLNPERETNYIRHHISDVDYKHDYSRSMGVIIHEVGHVLGMSHPFSVGENTVPFPLETGDDNKFNTAMAYNLGNIPSETYQPTSFRPYDIIALQHLYGKNENNNTDSAPYEYDDTYTFHQVIVDAAGDDLISVANSTRDNTIDLRSGKYSSIAPNYVSGYFNCPDGSSTGCGDNPHEHLNRSHNSLFIDVDTLIENATGGSGNDTLVANYVANDINGGDGVDTVMFAGAKIDYTIDIVNSFTVIVTSNTDAENVDTLTGVEFLNFVSDFSDLSTAEIVALNQAPVVTVIDFLDAKSSQEIVISAAATDAENNELTFLWTQVSGTEVVLKNADTMNVSFTAPTVTDTDVIRLELTVSDGVNVVIKQITVAVLPNNMPVITDVTADQTVDERTTVTLTVAATDADNEALTYRWVVNGATVILTGDTSDTVTFTAPEVTTATNLTVQVFVTDGFDEVSSEIRTITVNNIDTTPDPVVTPPKKESSGGGSFGYLILLIAGLRLFRK